MRTQKYLPKILRSVTSLATILFSAVLVADGGTYNYPRSDKVVIDTNMLGECMAGVIAFYDRPDTFNKEGTLCKPFTNLTTIEGEEAKIAEIRKNNTQVESCKFRGVNSILYLNAQETRKYDYFSGHEDTLKSWIMSQDDNSITPFSLFFKAMEITEGNTWLAVLTIHQLLRNEVRWNRGLWYNYESSVENETKFINKFVDIRGDLKELGGEALGDHGGSWYRFYASMLDRISYSTSGYSYSYGDQSSDDVFQNDTFSNLEDSMMRVVNGLGVVRNHAMNQAAEKIKIFIPHGKLDKRKLEINNKGGDTGGAMVKSLIPCRSCGGLTIKEECWDSRSYLAPVSKN